MLLCCCLPGVTPRGVVCIYPTLCVHLSSYIYIAPSHTGKTLLARAVANQMGVRFVCASISQLVRGEVGESERAVRTVFSTAMRLSPCVLFLDEIEAVFGSRDTAGSVGKKLVSQLLVEMDRVYAWSGETGQTERGSASFVLVLAATNRPAHIDTSLFTSGRLETCLHVTPPDAEARNSILAALQQGQEWGGVAPSDLAAVTEGYTGADLKQLVNRAGWIAALRGQAEGEPTGEGVMVMMVMVLLLVVMVLLLLVMMVMVMVLGGDGDGDGG